MGAPNTNNWELMFDPRAANGDFIGSYDVGARWDRLNIRESLKAGVLYEGMVWRNVLTGTVLIVIKSAKTGSLVTHEVDFERDWA